MGNVRDLESFKLIKESEKAIDGIESIMYESLSWPEEMQVEFLKQSQDILNELENLLKSCNKSNPNE